MNAYLVFLDESGFLMAPLVRRNWAPRGLYPLLHQRTCSHHKVSIITALCVNPTRDQVRCYSRLHTDANIHAGLVVDVLRPISRQLDAPWVLIWDRLHAHRAKTTLLFLESSPAIQPVLLPAYAPELNPVEYVWGHLKANSLANLAPLDCTVP